ncbi:MAG: sigma-70 family RNA polymerase sigma factor [Chloroflexi bacterium]|nr:sigma-70 family RNA polymerase sigma factor [Chloroflexota bacterium]
MRTGTIQAALTPGAQVDEQRAILRLKQGDIGGLAVLVKRYQTQAIQTAYLITHDLPLAEDVVQDVFLQIYRYIGRFDPDRPFAPWFMRSVVNAAVQAAKRQQAALSLDHIPPEFGSDGDITFADLLPDPAPTPDSVLEIEEIETAVEQALRQLPPEQRAAIVLRYYLDLDDETIAAELHCAPGTVRWRLHTARKQLAIILRRLIVMITLVLR